MEIFTVSFFGHRKVSQFSLVEERLEAVIQRLLEEKEYVEFLVGRSGEFDQLASSAVRRTKRTLRDDNSALVLVLPISQQNTGTTRIASTITMTKSKSVKAPPRHILRLPCRFVTRQWLTDPTWSSAALSMIAAEPIRRCSMPESSKSGSSILQIYLPNK